MTRSDVYELVWQLPMAKLAPGYGLTDSGFAKTCRKLSIPFPPRGYWAKLAAGKSPHRPTLDGDPNQTVDLRMLNSDEMSDRERVRAARMQEVAEQREFARTAPTIAMPLHLSHAHPLVKATADYCARIPRLQAAWDRRDHSRPLGLDVEFPPHATNGRFSFAYKGLLDISAGLSEMDWILRFHSAVMGALGKHGMVFESVQGDQRHIHTVEGRLDGERITLSFSDGYRRVPVSPSKSIGSSIVDNKWAYPPSGKGTFRAKGASPFVGQEWILTRPAMEGKLGEIVQVCLALIAQQPVLRERRRIAEADAQAEAAKVARHRSTQKAREDQVGHALALAIEYENRQRVESYLAQVECWLPKMKEPFNRRARVWLDIVRAELERNHPAMQMAGRCLTINGYWSKSAPAWWPEGDPSGDWT